MPLQRSPARRVPKPGSVRTAKRDKSRAPTATAQARRAGIFVELPLTRSQAPSGAEYLPGFAAIATTMPPLTGLGVCLWRLLQICRASGAQTAKNDRHARPVALTLETYTARPGSIQWPRSLLMCSRRKTETLESCHPDEGKRRHNDHCYAQKHGDRTNELVLALSKRSDASDNRKHRKQNCAPESASCPIHRADMCTRRNPQERSSLQRKPEDAKQWQQKREECV